ncbi:hypothetical protein, partial [Streptosporangium oxazolinicum]|uniref:hypothetical protein n=1 Tax=Streptosporangium oxazolinicum TaxID=909287 RepID=UPI0031ED591E
MNDSTTKAPTPDITFVLEQYLQDIYQPGDDNDKFARLDAIASGLALNDQRGRILHAALAIETVRLNQDEHVTPKAVIARLPFATPLQRGKTFVYDLIRDAPAHAANLTNLIAQEQATLAAIAATHSARTTPPPPPPP